MQYLHPHIKRNEITPLIVFSFFIALSVVLSNHIQITGKSVFRTCNAELHHTLRPV